MSRCLVIGCGSIGARRARILAEMGHEVDGYDVEALRAMKATGGYDVSWLHVQHLRGPYDAIFLCTPADTHVRVAFDCLQLATAPAGLFVEKPLSVNMDGVAELCDVAEGLGVITMGACNMRWAYGDIGPATSTVDAVVSRPLSLWGPDSERYRRAGIVLEAAIHEMDLCYYLAGPITGVTATGDDDVAHIAMTHERDVESTVYADWHEVANVRRKLLVDGERYDAVTSDTMYREEMAHFLDAVAAGGPTCNPLRSAAHVLEWALVAKEQTMGARV